MRFSTSALAAALAATPLLVTPARAAFEGDFALVDAGSPPGYYTFDSEISQLGRWSAGFFPSEDGTSFIDTTAAPCSVTLGASTVGSPDFTEGATTLFIELPVTGSGTFTIQIANNGAGDYYAGTEIFLSGVALYTLTDPDGIYTLSFDAFAGETIEFRSIVISAGESSFASNQAIISHFTYPSTEIPEPAAFASLAGLIALGGAACRRRRG
jgi:hypothetical protein